jgi:hypothetical protein
MDLSHKSNNLQSPTVDLCHIAEQNSSSRTTPG